MDDDFNTPLAIAVLFDLANEINKTKSAELARQLIALAGIIGLLQRDPRDFLQGVPVSLTGVAAQGEVGSVSPSMRSLTGVEALGAVEELIAERIIAKKAKNFALADRIRADLLQQGIILEDKPGGLTEWRRA